jgi:predicted ATPase/class 3 adenylate cyclase
MFHPPTGTVTFLFTDIEGSTTHWEHHPAQMQTAFARQEAILRHAIEANGGYAYKMIGDAFQAAFATALQALQTALNAQRALHTEQWPSEIGEVRVRMALHTGVTEVREGDYVGPMLNRVARLLSVGYGGQVLLTRATYELVRYILPEGLDLRDLGEHRLKDLIQPEQIFQLVAPDLPSDFPPLKTLDNQRNNLPLQPTPLIGREKEMANVEALLSKEDVRLVTLTGPGGIGKTRLALQVGAELVGDDSYKDGVWLVDMAPIEDATLVVSSIAQVLGVKESAVQPLLDNLVSFLKEEHLLLILDNFEQVVEAAPQIAKLISSSEGVKFLVTSRMSLRIRGEHEYPVPPLTLPDVYQGNVPNLDDLSQYEAVKLFVERAQAVKPDFAITNQNAAAVAEICAHLDGLPLAIELAAARVKLLPPQAMLGKVQSSLKLLTGGARDLPARQQTLRGAIQWSYDLLDESEKALFIRLAVFSGGCTLEAAEAVCQPSNDRSISSVQPSEMDIIGTLASLIDKNLLRQEEQDGEPRFSMLTTIREYALEKLAERGQATAGQCLHAEYYLPLAEAAEPQISGATQKEWLERLEREHDNLRAALDWGLAHGESKLAGRLSVALWRFWWLHGHLTEGRNWLARVLGTAAELPPALRAKVLGAAGELASRHGDYASAKAFSEASLALWRELGDRVGIAYALNNLGVVAGETGDSARARALGEESLALLRALGDRRGLAVALSNLGDVARDQEDYATARSLYEESVALLRELGDRGDLATTLHDLAATAWRQGDDATARSLLEENLELARELGDRRGFAYTLGMMGLLTWQQGDYAKARALGEESLGLVWELGDRAALCANLEFLAMVAAAERRFERAARLGGAAVALRESLGTPQPGFLRNAYNQVVTAARTQLGAAAWATAWAAGQEMTLEQVIAYALESANHE